MVDIDFICDCRSSESMVNVSLKFPLIDIERKVYVFLSLLNTPDLWQTQQWEKKSGQRRNHVGVNNMIWIV